MKSKLLPIPKRAIVNVLVASVATGVSVGVVYYLVKPKVYNYNIPYDKNSLVPILAYAHAAHTHGLPLMYDVPEYNNSNKEVFDFLVARTLTITSVIKKNSTTYSSSGSISNDYSLATGTGFILGKASSSSSSDQGSSNEGDWYFLASNEHVIKDFSNPNFYQGFYGFNPYLLEKSKNNQYPSRSELTDNLDNLKVTFSTSSSSSDMKYYKMVVDTKWSYKADNVFYKHKSPIVRLHTGGVNINQKADFGVIKVNLKPSANQYQYTFNSSSSGNSLRSASSPTSTNDSYLKNNPTSDENYLKKLKESVDKYGDISFSSDNVNEGYLFGYPKANKSSSINQIDTIGLNLHLSGIRKTARKMGYDPGSDLYPTVDYNIPFFNLFPGASGSPLISYHPNKDDKSKFSMSGIYWGIVIDNSFNINANALVNYTNQQRLREQSIPGTVGMISKLIDKDDYDLISRSSLSSSRHSSSLNNSQTGYQSLCDAIESGGSGSYTINQSETNQRAGTNTNPDSSPTTYTITKYTPTYCSQRVN